MITKIEKVLLTGKTRTTASGRANRLNINLSTPRGQANTEHCFEDVAPHPFAEQLFAGAWSGCFMTALGIAAKEKEAIFPADAALEIEVDLGTGGSEHFLQARLYVSLPGLDQAVAEAVVHAADKICVYSKAVRGNIDVQITVNDVAITVE